MRASLVGGVAIGALIGCQEYNLQGEGASSVGDTAPAQPDDSAADTGQTCEEVDASGFGGPTDESCVNEVQTGTFTPIREWGITAFSAAPAYNNVMMQPIVASLTDDDGDGDIDTDDVPDILITSYTGSSWTSAGALRALSGDGSGPIWTDTAAAIQGSGSLAAGDIDNDGIIEIIAGSTTGRVVAFEHDGTVKWTSSASVSGCYALAPAISDMDSDGRPEIIASNLILNSDGTTRATVSTSNGECVSFAADIDADGTEELIAGGSVFTIDGVPVWTTSYDGYPAVADFDGDGRAEVVLSDTSGVVRLFSTDGALLWSSTLYGLYGPPTIADFDGDGEPEIGVAGTSTYTVIEGDGSIRWQNSTTDASSGRTGSAVFDFEGDGVAEVVYADEYTLWVYSGVDGAVKLQEANHTSWTWIEYATIADVDGDGEAEIVLPNGSIGGNTSGAVYGLAVYGDADNSWMAGRKIWNQHAYSITNVNDDGTIPRTADLNWLTYNSFRSGDLRAGSGTDSVDAQLAEGGVCALECDTGLLRFWVHPGNEGVADVTLGGSISAHAVVGGERVLLEERGLAETVPAGRYLKAEVFDFVDADLASWEAVVFDVVVNEPECDAENNRVRFVGPFCP